MKFGSNDISKVMLGSTEVSAVYVGSTKVYPLSSGYSAPDYATTGIQVYYNPQDPSSYSGTGTILEDLSGNAYHATISNGPAFSDNSFTLDGVDDYVTTPNMITSFNNTSAFTVEIWYAPNYTVQGAGGTVMSETGTAIPNTSWHYSLFEHRKASFGALAYDYAGIWTGLLTAVNPTQTFNNLVWRNQILTYDGTNARIYTNGTLGRTVALTRLLPWNAGHTGYHLHIGAPDSSSQSGAGNSYFKGKIGIVRAYNRALSQSEVTQNYNGARAIYGLA